MPVSAISLSPPPPPSLDLLGQKLFLTHLTHTFLTCTARLEQTERERDEMETKTAEGKIQSNN